MSPEIPAIGRLLPVSLREVWTSEPYQFTPWLAAPENLQFLAESLDLPGLELVRTEHPVDSFSADIVAKIVDTDHFVLIENQLERTDHLHLGQVLTYAPRFDARVVVWVASEFTDAHRAALDWLNRISGESYAFFGVEVRAVRIGDSIPAPLFDVVAKPNEWARVGQATAQAQEALSEQAASNVEYWTAFHRVLAATGGPLRQTEKPLKDVTYWAPIAGGGRAYIWAFRSLSKKPYVNAGMSFYNRGAQEVWTALKADEDRLNNEFGEPLKWYSNKRLTAFHIQCASRPSLLEHSDRPSQQDWLAERMRRFDRLFSQPMQLLFEQFDADEQLVG